MLFAFCAQKRSPLMKILFLFLVVAAGCTESYGRLGEPKWMAEPVAVDQGSPADRPDPSIQRDIRLAIVNDGRMSKLAQRITIVADHGRVMLSGPVASDGERQRIIDLARQV